MATTGEEDRQWVLEEAPDPAERVLLGGFLVVVWAPIEVALARLVVVVPDEVSDLPLVSLLLVALAGWSYPGCAGLRHVTNGNRGRVITADRHGIRSERITRRGRRRQTAAVGWDDIHTVDAGPNHLRVEGGDGQTTLSYVTGGSHHAIAEYITTRITPPEGRPRLPVVQGFTAYVDDRGPTISTRRESRLRDARWAGGIAALLWADTAAAATDLGDLWGLVGILGAAAAGMTAAAVRLVRATPRWTAMPGAVVRIDKPGGEVTFRATVLELTEGKREGDGVVCTELAAFDGARRAPMIYGPADGATLAETARWLADAAEIPFRDKRSHEVSS